ncbi:MAG: UDP-N-acetylmuramate--L-alanine ligase [Raoultibacter sp.]
MAKRHIKAVHFIGIGGVGMSGIAHVAHDQGMRVSGSDLKESRYTIQLKEAGVAVYIGHDADNIPEQDPDVVVVSTAILDNNPELAAAKARGLEIWHRAKMLAALGVDKQTLAVAGTHGKTTTSSMLASTLDAMGEDPSFLIGGIVRSYQTNAHSGSGAYYVVEADESDKSFTYLNPQAVLVTNVEADHLDHYSGLEEIHELFSEFIGSVPDDGVVVICGEDADLVRVAGEVGHRFFTYGFGNDFDIVISDYVPVGIGSAFNISFPDGLQVRAQVLQNPGRHNVLNAAGTLGLIWALGLPVDQAVEALGKFAGVRRRFDSVGVARDITVVDDYAHHPTEIAATIAAAKQLDFKRVHVLFQPHRYSRVTLFTEVLKDEFGSAFDEADSVTFMDVYPAGEAPVPGVSGKTFMNVVLDHVGHPQAAYVPRRVEVVPYLISKLQPGDLLITMGAGDVTAVGPQIISALESGQ